MQVYRIICVVIAASIVVSIINIENLISRINIPDILQKGTATIAHNPFSLSDDDRDLDKSTPKSPGSIKRELNISGDPGKVILEWDPDRVFDSSKFSTDTMKHEYFMFLEVWNRRPLKLNPGGMGFPHQFLLWFSARRVKPKLIVESGMKSGATTWLLHEAAPTAKIISFEPMIQKDWVSIPLKLKTIHSLFMPAPAH